MRLRMFFSQVSFFVYDRFEYLKVSRASMAALGSGGHAADTHQHRYGQRVKRET